MTDDGRPDSDAENVLMIHHPVVAVVWLSIVAVLAVLGILPLSGRIQALITSR